MRVRTILELLSFKRGVGCLVVPTMLGGILLAVIVESLVAPGTGSRGWVTALGMIGAGIALRLLGDALCRRRGPAFIDEQRKRVVHLRSNDTLGGVHVRDWSWFALGMGVLLLVA